MRKTPVFFQLLPVFGTVWFILLYILATLHYPGGNYLNKNSPQFSWTQNYWCNLLNTYAINGQPNAARPIAMIAMIILCIAIASFWVQFPLWANVKPRLRLIVQISGCASMALTVLVATRFHDTIINIAGLFGLVALAGTLVGLRKNGSTGLFYTGVFIVVLVGVNNYLYYENDSAHILAVVQKITFLYVLLWISLVNLVCVLQQKIIPDKN